MQDFKVIFIQKDGDLELKSEMNGGSTTSEIVENFYSFMVAATHHPINIAEAMRDQADEILPDDS